MLTLTGHGNFRPLSDTPLVFFISQALRSYEKERLPRVKAILSVSELVPERQILVNQGTFAPLA